MHVLIFSCLYWLFPFQPLHRIHPVIDTTQKIGSAAYFPTLSSLPPMFT
jgi:hypothetical protein